MLRVVIDSNIYISALLFGGNPRSVIHLVESRLIQLCVSPPIRAEVERILKEKFHWPRTRVRDATSYLWSIADNVDPAQTITDCVDPDDNRILECAVEAGANMIVTGDSDLLSMNPYEAISIVTAKQFLEHPGIRPQN